MLNVKLWDMYSTSHKEAQQDRVATSTSSSEQYKHMHRYTRWTRYYKDFWKKQNKTMPTQKQVGHIEVVWARDSDTEFSTESKPYSNFQHF